MKNQIKDKLNWVFVGVMLLSLLSSEKSYCKTSEEVIKRITPIKKSAYYFLPADRNHSWDNWFLNKTYKAPKRSHYIYLPATHTDTLDMIRIRYTVGKKYITITQTSCLYQLVVEREIKSWVEKRIDEIEKERGKKIEKKGRNKSSRDAKVKDLLSKIFIYGNQVKLKIEKNEDQYMEGVVSVSEKLLEKAPWFESFQWCWDHGDIRFLFVKKVPKRSAAFFEKTDCLKDNESWFYKSPKLQNK